jgi:hydrogenase-4 membrane subunit HyfE
MSDAIKTVTITPAQERFSDWAADVLVYTVVLNLFVEYNSKIIIDSFTISIFTAVVLKVLLDLLTATEHKVSHFFGQYAKWLGFVSMWAVLFLSKFVILEVIDIIFGEHVELGKFLDVVFLVITMMVVRELVARTYAKLGAGSDDEAAAH